MRGMTNLKESSATQLRVREVTKALLDLLR
jgi:hypothetical protein